MLSCTLLLAGTLVLATPPSQATPMSEPDANPRENPVDAARPNLQSATLGGKQFWGDELVFHGWRIQRNVYTGHCRLLDAEDVRHTWGSFEACQAELARIRAEQKLPPMRGRVVLVLHGLIRTRSAMLPLADYLQEHLPTAIEAIANQTTGAGELPTSEPEPLKVITISYPSTRAEVARHASELASVIKNLGPEVTRIDFVAHSLGNIVVRHYLADCLAAQGRIDPRLHRMVMIAPPNRGSLRAMEWSDNPLFKLAMGSAGQELSIRWEQLQQHLATPPFPFAIIAGAKGDGVGWKDYLPGDDDACVSVATTRLAGAADFTTVPVKHTFIMNDRRVQEYTARFLAAGYLKSPDQMCPVVDEGNNSER